jgi:hypothetical protein
VVSGGRLSVSTSGTEEVVDDRRRFFSIF